MKVGDKVWVKVSDAYRRGYNSDKRIPGTIIAINKRGFAKVQYGDFWEKKWAEYYENKGRPQKPYIIRRKLITRHVDKLKKGGNWL